MGRTFCEGKDVQACWVSAHAVCGLICQKQRVLECDTCTMQDGEPLCKGSPLGDPPPCVAHPCAGCPAGGQTYCAGSAIYRCQRAAYAGDTCDEICAEVEVSVCPARCEQDLVTGEARCAD